GSSRVVARQAALLHGGPQRRTAAGTTQAEPKVRRPRRTVRGHAPGARHAAWPRLAVAVGQPILVELVVAVAVPEVARGALVIRHVRDREPRALLAHVSARSVEECGLAGAAAA